MTAPASGPLFRPYVADPSACGSGCCPEPRPLKVAGDPVDLGGLAALLRSGLHGRQLRVRLVMGPGEADAPLILWDREDGWAVGRPGARSVLAVIPAGDPALAADYPIGA